MSLFAFAAATVPTDVAMPGTQPSEVPSLTPPAACFACHADFDPVTEPGRNWEGSMMAHATRDPLFWAALAVAEQDFDGSGDMCLRCHTPNGWLSGRSTPTDGSALIGDDAFGVSCDTCHRLTNPNDQEYLGVHVAPFVANDGGSPPVAFSGSGQYVISADPDLKLGPYYDAVTPHTFTPSDFHRQSQSCGTCHDVSNPITGDLAPNNGAQIPLAPGTFSGVAGSPPEDKAAFHNFPYQYGVVERTFSEHQASAYATLPVGDFPALPTELRGGALLDAYQAATAVTYDGSYEDGTPRTYSCQTCHMKPVPGKGCNLPFAPTRSDVPQHDLTGGNYWVPELITYLELQGKLLIGGGMDFPTLIALDQGADRARDNLEAAASLRVEGDTLKVINRTGHKLITGYPDGRRMWVHATWFDGVGGVLREDGAYGAITADVDGLPTPVDTLLDPSAPNTRVYEAHFGISQEWAAKLLTLGTPGSLVLDYDRQTGAPGLTLGALAAMSPGSVHDSFHFALNDTLTKDNRIPPYGFRYDDARVRNALPVPETLYGDPGAGGVYEHFDLLDLDPPRGAVSATIELLYQPTSWEYVQFLHLANDGGNAFLAEVGDDLLEGWLATGMAAPHVMASASWPTGDPTWTDLGQGLAGTKGVPYLMGTGSLVEGTPVSIDLSGTNAFASTNLVVGFSMLRAPFKGGTLVPSPDILLLGLSADADGALSLAAPWPTGIPGGVSFVFQHWIADFFGPAGFAASNALQALTP